MTIKVKVGAEEKELTPEQAKELWLQLSSLFGAKEKVFVPLPYRAPDPLPPVYPQTPWWELTWVGTPMCTAQNPPQ